MLNRERIASIAAILGLAVAGVAAMPHDAQAWWRRGYGVGVYVPPVVVAPRGFAPPAVYAPPSAYAPPLAYAGPPAAYYPSPRRVWIPPHWRGAYWIPGHWS